MGLLRRRSAHDGRQLSGRASFVGHHPTEFRMMPSIQLLFELNNFHRMRGLAKHNQNLARLDPYHLIHCRCGERRFDFAYLIGSWGDADLDGLEREAAGKRQ